MQRANPKILAAFLLVLLVLFGGLSVARGGFYIGKHEGDTLHLLQMIMRMAAGDWPHLDFMTPIGVLALAPVAIFVRAGFGIGHAILYGQILVALVCLPAIWWVAGSRFRGLWAYLFGAAVLILILALVHGQADRTISISMHYNRWAWAAAFLAISLTLLPSLAGHHPAAEGIIIGLALAAMALIKVTYFAGFAVPILVALVGRGSYKALLWTILSGLAVVILLTAMAGVEFWLAYLRDLVSVAGSSVRPQPGEPLGSVIGAPAYMGGSLVLLLAVILLRQSGRSLEGLVLLLLVPGFFYVTYQNFGNDPQWLGLLGVSLFALLPDHPVRNGLGWDLQKATMLAGTAALVFAAPSYLNLAYSPFRHLVADISEHAPLLPGSGRHEDIQTDDVRANRVDGKIAMDGPDTPFAAVTKPELREDITEFQGETLPQCSVELGMVVWFATMAADLKASGLVEDKTMFAADLLSSYWLYGASRPLPGGSPWYYGGLPGFSAADFLIVPLCPLSTRVRKMILDEVAESGVALTEVRRTELYILYQK